MAEVNVLSLFAGIGGLELGLERAGMTTVGQVEIDPFCRQVLAKHWPEVPKHDDVRTLVDWWRSTDRPRVDGVCGGFPCQDISNTGARVGITGPKSGLWKAMAFAIRELRPRFVIVENVAALLVRGIDVVLGDLHSLGFDAEWSTITACSLGAPHTRERLFILAYANDERPQTRGWRGVRDDETLVGGRVGSQYLHQAQKFGGGARGTHWENEPRLGRVADGSTDRLDKSRLFALGNAVVPQVAEFIGRQLMAQLSERAA
jgi:DNA (cytosine-5)-methyltransferase 1